jgi:hypothetical protein
MANSRQLAKNPHYTHLPIPAERFDVKGIEGSRNLSAKACLRQLCLPRHPVPRINLPA